MLLSSIASFLQGSLVILYPGRRGSFGAQKQASTQADIWTKIQKKGQNQSYRLGYFLYVAYIFTSNLCTKFEYWSGALDFHESGCIGWNIFKSINIGISSYVAYIFYIKFRFCYSLCIKVALVETRKYFKCLRKNQKPGLIMLIVNSLF